MNNPYTRREALYRKRYLLAVLAGLVAFFFIKLLGDRK